MLIYFAVLYTFSLWDKNQCLLHETIIPIFFFFFFDQEGLFCLLLDDYEKLLTGVGWEGGP